MGCTGCTVTMGQNFTLSSCQDFVQSGCQNRDGGSSSSTLITYQLTKLILFKKSLTPTDNMASIISFLTPTNIAAIMATLHWDWFSDANSDGLMANGGGFFYDLDAFPAFDIANGGRDTTASSYLYDTAWGCSGYGTEWDQRMPQVGSVPNPQTCFAYIMWNMAARLNFVGPLSPPLVDPLNPYAAIPSSASIYYNGTNHCAHLISPHCNGAADLNACIATISNGSVISTIPTSTPPNDLDGPPPAGAKYFSPSVLGDLGRFNVTENNPSGPITYQMYFEDYGYVFNP